MGDMREMLASFHETPDSKTLKVKSSPLIPHISAKHAFWLYEKYLADKGNKPDRKWVQGKPDGTCISEICAADHAQRKQAGFSEPKWLMLVNDEAHFERCAKLSALGPLAPQIRSRLSSSPCGALSEGPVFDSHISAISSPFGASC